MKLNHSIAMTLVAGLGLGLVAGFSACTPAGNGTGNGNTGSNENSNADSNENTNGSGDTDVIFPANYQDSYVEVRDCRTTVEHSDITGVFSVRVLASPDAEQAYLNFETIPEGGVIVKEEFGDFDCQVLVQYRPMKKEAAGFAPEIGDWHYQKVAASREILEEGEATCIGCHARPECVARDYMCTCPCPEEE